MTIMGDTQNMFNQVRVTSQDTNFLRFLWLDTGDVNKQVTDYQMIMHLFGVTFLPSCANFALRKTAQDQSERFNSEVIETVHGDFHVDDCLKSVEAVKDAVSSVRDMHDILKYGGFHITKWISNSREVVNSIPVFEKVKEIEDLDVDRDALSVERALGMQR